ncbi:trypsin-like peptidase domain-containing protein, partial [Candidatus Latescibacterota bacterium]
KVYFVLTILVLFSTVPSFAELPLNNNNESPFTRIYEKVSPAVVMIEVEGEAPRRGNNRVNNPWQRFFDMPENQEDQGTRPVEGMGSGVIFDREGHIITNNHVIQDAIKINVKLGDEEEYSAKIVGSDPLSDLAVIKLDLDGKLLPAERVAELGDSDTLRPGDYAIAIGNPMGLERTITVGIISALGRHNIPVSGSRELRFQDFIQTDAQINPGNSGGALVDINGMVVGINNMYAARYAAIGFAIPVNLAKGVVDRIIEFGEVKRGFVGIKSDPINDDTRITKDIQEAMGLESTDGVLLNEIVADSPAEIAGLENGDVIVSLDGVKIKDFNDFLLKIGEHVPGDTVKLGVIHEGKQKTVDLTLGDRDKYETVASTSGSGNSWRGISVIDLDDEMAQQYGLDKIKSGVVIVHIEEESFASDTDLREGDVIIEIENKLINNTGDFESIKEELKDSDKRILIYRARKISNGSITKRYVTVKGK